MNCFEVITTVANQLAASNSSFKVLTGYAQGIISCESHTVRISMAYFMSPEPLLGKGMVGDDTNNTVATIANLCFLYITHTGLHCHMQPVVIIHEIFLNFGLKKISIQIKFHLKRFCQ